jgi:hypothetical protein
MTLVGAPGAGGRLSGVNFGFPPALLQEDAAMVKAPAVQVRKFRLSIWNSEKDRFAFVLG